MKNNNTSKKHLRNIVFLGLVSFFADISSQMVYPLIPLYLTTSFGATPVLVGIIEGIAESVASLLKVFSGYFSDKYNHKKAIAFCGYASGLFYKLALIFAGSWVGILGARVIDRLGKGIRTAPRDVMVSESAEESHMGKAFGIHKALDMAGSAIGILLSFFLLKKVGDNAYRTVFALSIIPVLIALAMFFFIEEKRGNREIKQKEHFWNNVGKLDSNLKLYLLVTFIFTLGNSSNSFLLLKATDIGFTSTNTILLYFIYNITAASLAIHFGKRSDKVGRKKILIKGYILFAVVYLGFAFASQKWMLVISFIIYGFYTAMVTGVERAFISEISPHELKGTMLGLHSTIVGIALLPASIIAGILWNNIGSYAPFIFGAALSSASALLLCVFFNRNSSKNHNASAES
ncbi:MULTISPECIES: MFS transporter [unclassified Sedimentibacter]|uniref:MFS transporter n=1 Tax=unclassified Sedimentibacter TaxID=2649220 RepID=UPI0035A6F6A5